MPRFSPDLILFALAGGCLWLGLVLSQARVRWSTAGRTLLMAAAVCAVGTVIVAVATHGGAIGSGAQLLALSAGAVPLWHSLHPASPSPRWVSLVLGAVTSLLFGWAASSGWYLQASSQNGPQAWHAVAYIPLALACGAFIETGCVGIAQWRPNRDVQPSTGRDTVRLGTQLIALALALLTVSILLTMVGTLFVTGNWWNWSTAEAWTLVLLLWQGISWWGAGILHWRGRGAAVVSALGLLVTFASLYAIVA